MGYANNWVYYFSDYGIPPNHIIHSEDIDNIPSILTSKYLPALEAEGMLFEGWYTTPTFDEGTLAEPGVFIWDKTTSLRLYAKWSSSATVSQFLVNLADEFRDFTNTTDKMGLSKMAEYMADANEEISEQDVLVEQLISTMQGKAVVTPYQACSVTYHLEANGDNSYEIFYCKNGVWHTEVRTTGDIPYNIGTIDADVGSFVVFSSLWMPASSIAVGVTITGGENYSYRYDADNLVVKLTDTQCSITL